MNLASKTTLLVALFVAGLGCGYSSPKSASPSISVLNPAAITAGGAQFQLEVDGANFATGSVVNFNGAAELTTVVSSTRLETTVPAAAIMNAGMVPVTVTNPGTSSGMYTSSAMTSAAMNFTIN